MITPSEGELYPAPEEESRCDFCEIVANGAPARVCYEDDEVIVIRNRLRWAPVMLLVMPRKHITQQEMWRGPIIERIARVAVEMGVAHCPGGFRLLSNFGSEAMQSQEHAHLHVLGGTKLGRYV